MGVALLWLKYNGVLVRALMNYDNCLFGMVTQNTEYNLTNA